MNESDDVVVLGSQLAAARAAEERHIAPAPSPIADVSYEDRAADFWRWVDSPTDATLSSFVVGFAAADEPTRVRLRGSLTMSDFYTLMLFAKRRAFAAIRTGDPRGATSLGCAVTAAFDAVSTIDVERVDWRDVVVTARMAAYAASRCDIRASVAAAGAIGRATPTVAEILTHAAGDGAADLAMAGYRVVTGADGPVLFMDGYRPYRPRRDLAPVAASLAEAIERDGTYAVEEIGIGVPLADIWVGSAADALTTMTGCVSVHGRPRPAPDRGRREHFLLAYVAELATPEDAARVAESASRAGRPGSVVTGVASGAVVAVVIAACVRADQPSFETAESLARFREPIAALLG